MIKKTEKAYEVKRSFNNNIVLVDDDKKEIILFAKGIGFNCKKGSIIPENTNIEKIFTIQDENNIANFRRVIGSNDEKFIAFCEELILEISRDFNEELNEIIHIGLIDHISFSIESIVEDEIGFIAMHIHSARTTGKISHTIKFTYISNTAVEYIEDAFNIVVDRTSLSYARFISHLRFAIERLINNTPIKNELLSIIKLKYPESFKVSEEIGKAINEDFSLKVAEDEIGYLALHVERIRKNE